MAAPAIAGFLTGLSLIVAIGAQNVFVLRQGLLRQYRLTVAAICAGADALLIAAGIQGIGAAVSGFPELIVLTRYGGALFLAVYGALVARRAWQGHSLRAGNGAALPYARAVALCLALTFLNPHVYLDTVVLLGALASQHGASGRWHFGAGAALASLAWFFLLAYGAGRLQPLFARPLAWRVLDGAIALVMGTLACGLLRG